MKDQNTKRNVYGYVAAALALVMVIVGSVAFFQQDNTAGAETVTLSENATVVTSPFTEAVQKVHGSVVGVNNYTTYRSSGYYGYGYGFGYGYGNGRDDSDSNRQVLQGSGSGVVVANGYVLTNYHVVEDATTLEVTSGENVYPAELKGYDAARDIAVLQVADMDIAPVTLGDSDLLNVGDWAICIGNPLSFTGTTTVGVISALNREITSSATDAYGKRTTNTMIQTDAAINAGNSGGGMFNVAGELIGVPSMKYTGSMYSGSTVEGIGMAIPINACKELINDVLAGNGNVKSNGDKTTNSTDNSIVSSGKPRIGVTVSNLSPQNYAVANGIVPKGAYVTKIEEGSPAEKAGIKVADIVVEVDGNIVTNTTQMVSILQAKQAGDTADIKVYRVEGGLDSYDDPTAIPEGEYIDLKVELVMLDDVKQ